MIGLITGATSGIGKELSKLLASKGIHLILTGRNEEELKLLKESLSRLTTVDTFPADLATPEGRKTVVDAIHEKVPDLVINNAGFGLLGNALTTSTAEQMAILEVNCKALLELSLEAARTLIAKEKKGVILNVSSAAAFQYFPGFSVYSASKSFVDHFSQAFDLETKPYGVRVLTSYPGFVETQFSERARAKPGKRRFDKMTAPFVAEQIWTQIEKLQPFKIIDWKIRVLTFLSFFVPLKWKARLGEQIIASRLK